MSRERVPDEGVYPEEIYPAERTRRVGRVGRVAMCAAAVAGSLFGYNKYHNTIDPSASFNLPTSASVSFSDPWNANARHTLEVRTKHPHFQETTTHADASSSQRTSSSNPSSANTSKLDTVTASGGDVKVMVLGDSIGTGFESSDNGGYRTDLYNDLPYKIYKTTFVGSQHSGPSYLGGEETYPGKTCGYLDSIISQRLTTFQPQIVMLECGANDIETGTSPAATVSLISTIISKIEVQQPTDIILAGLTPINIPNTAQYNYNSLATEVNSMLPAIATTYKAEGYPVSYVDMYSKMNVTNASGAFALITPVQDHPNNGGYEEMSKLWLPPLVSDIRQIQAG